MKVISRDLLLIVPRKPFYDWLNFIYEEAGEYNSENLLNDNTEVYLIQEYDTEQDFLVWMKKNYITFFEATLNKRSTEKKSWPQNRTWEVFNKWFYASYHPMIYDLAQKPIKTTDIT
jgi:hypothetical protein